MAIEKGAAGIAAEVNAAFDARAKYATGSYTGNDADDRQITTGFQCVLVLIRQSANQYGWICFETGVSWKLLPAPSIAFNATDVLLHATDGFVVDGANANASGVTYYYTAIGRGD